MDIEKHYRRHYKNLLAVAKRNVTDNAEHLATECVNQTYENLMTYISAGNEIDEDRVDGLIFRILFNVVHDCNTCEMKRGMTGRTEDGLRFTETVEAISDEGRIPLNTFRRMCLNIIMGKYKRQGLRRDKILNLYFVQGLSHQEIAKELGISTKTSRNIVYTELNKLRTED